MICGAAVASIGGAMIRVDKPPIPAALLAIGIGLIHYMSYSQLSVGSIGEIIGVGLESGILFAVAMICFVIVAARQERKRRGGTGNGRGESVRPKGH